MGPEKGKDLHHIESQRHHQWKSQPQKQHPRFPMLISCQKIRVQSLILGRNRTRQISMEQNRVLNCHCSCEKGYQKTILAQTHQIKQKDSVHSMRLGQVDRWGWRARRRPEGIECLWLKQYEQLQWLRRLRRVALPEKIRPE